MCKLPISNHFGAIHCRNVRRSSKSQEVIKTTYFGVQGRLRSSMLLPPRKLVRRVCHDAASLCLSATDGGKITTC